MGRSLTGKVASSKKLNRKIFLGTEPGDGVPVTYNWSAPVETTEVEIHVWGAGGRAIIGGTKNYGGSGGGYASGVFDFNSTTDSLTIEVGTACTSGVSGPAGINTSYVYVNQPIGVSTLIGGGAIPGADPSIDGAVGEGSYILAAGLSTSRMFTANGGAGGEGPSQSVSGGGAGFIYGPGGNGAQLAAGDELFVSGGGIRGDGKGASDPTPPISITVDSGGFYPAEQGGGGFSGAAGGPPTQSWFYLEDIAGDGSVGGAGAGERYDNGAIRAGVFGGGGGADPPSSVDYIGTGGYGGGGGGGDAFPAPAGVTSPGIVIIYY